jgi:hypothetical protein
MIRLANIVKGSAIGTLPTLLAAIGIAGLFG